MMSSSDLPMVSQEPPVWFPTSELPLSEFSRVIEEFQNFLDTAAQLPTPTVKNFLKPIIDYDNRLRCVAGRSAFLQYISDDEDIRYGSRFAEAMTEAFYRNIFLREDLFRQFQKVRGTFGRFRKGSKGYEMFWFLTIWHKRYVKNGFELFEYKREKLGQLSDALEFRASLFGHSINHQKEEFLIFTKEELDGVPDPVMEQFTQFQDEDCVIKYKVHLQESHISPLLRTARNPSTRRLAYIKNQNKAHSNQSLLVDILSLRDEIAELFRRPDWATYRLKEGMAWGPETVWTFLREVEDKFRPLALKELKNLKQIEQREYESLGLPYNDAYYVWDHYYYDNKFLRDTYNVDSEKISEYYPLKSTVNGLLSICEVLFKLKFVEETSVDRKSVWHEDVKQLAVWKMDKPSKPEFLGWIYFDLYQRDSKNDKTGNVEIFYPYMKEDGTRSCGVAVLLYNFLKPSAEKPCLLQHKQIIEFFHQLGRAIQLVVGKNRIGSLNGTELFPRDFRTAPFQMLEFWLWDEDRLYELSEHYESGEKIPRILLRSLISTKNVDRGLFILRQVYFSAFDMYAHTKDGVRNDLELSIVWNQLRQKVSLVEHDELTEGYNSFLHIANELYCANYYSYLWNEALAADMYHTRFAADPLNSDAGVEFRDLILANGGMLDVYANVYKFLGREPSNEAFYKESGLS